MFITYYYIRFKYLWIINYMKEFKDTYRPLPNGLTIMESKIEGLGLWAKKIFEMRCLEKLMYQVTTRREWVRTPLGGFINHSEEPNCYISTDTEERILHSVRPINHRRINSIL